MAKKSSVEKNNHRKALVKRFAEKRKALLATANNESLEMEERFEARLKLAELPRNSPATRIPTHSRTRRLCPRATAARSATGPTCASAGCSRSTSRT